jgi:uncharacterized protein
MTTPAAGSAQPAPLTNATNDLLGRFVWYDLMTPDVAAAVAFYPAVTGWTTNVWEMGPGQTYTMWVAPSGTSIGGTMQMPNDQVEAGVPPHWIAYVGTPDVDATHAEALRLGATTHVPPTDIPTVGRFAVLADPQGATFALYAPADLSTVTPEPDFPGIGEMSWHELYTTDLDAAFAFYSQLFGWKEQSAMDMGPMGKYLMYGRGDKTYGGIMKRPSEETPSCWNLYARVPSLDAALGAVRGNGGQVIMGPQEVPGGDVVAICTDPRGGMFSLHEKRS